MNFDGVKGIEDIAVELKYCERCGGLWLRRRGTAGVHCSGCRVRLTELIHPRVTNSQPESKKPRPVRVDWLLGVARTEVPA